MDAGSFALSAVQTLLAALQCTALKEMASKFNYKSKLDDLQRTVCTVKAVLLDAENKEELSNEARVWLQELKDAVYDADDLFDEFATLARRNKLLEDGKVSQKVRLLLSRYNPFGIAHSMSQRVKKIRKNLDDIAKNHRDFGFNICFNPDPIRRRREETCSYVYEANIIGREEDVEKLVAILLDGNTQKERQRNISFLSIVGMGGLGKTALAQLVFNDSRVKSSFPSLRVWTCVSDHDQVELDVEGILRKILASATGSNQDGLPKEEVQRRLREILASNKYLLVLDDVWTEKRNQWLNLVEFLLGGQRGSWIVVTTRSQETARIVGSDSVHQLQGLSKENSWRLFEKVAFESEQSNPDDDFVEIGKKIVDGCARVPLALKVVGSLLFGQDKCKWQSAQEMGLANIRENQNDILPILKLSYHNLDSSLKSCFSFCALFPKDSVIYKFELLNLWIAQGYVTPLDEGQSIEDAAEEHFSVLLRKCFFQDVEQDEYGEIISCKMHDLMHDVAQKVAGNEIFISDSTIGNLDKRVRHVALLGSTSSQESSFTAINHVRSYLHWSMIDVNQSNLRKALTANLKCVRILELRFSTIKILPKEIGELLHLRYLNLSSNRNLEVLPESIRKLCNLETLILEGCNNIKELPVSICKLVRLRVLIIRKCRNLSCIHGNMGNLTELRVLDNEDCDSLTHMPCGLGKLTNLHRLPMFVVGETGSSCMKLFDQLEDLKALKNLKGKLRLVVKLENRCKIDGEMKGEYLKNKEYLKAIRFDFGVKGAKFTDIEEVLMEGLQPHHNLKEIELYGYHGLRMPSWETSLPNIVRLKILSCKNLRSLKNLSSLNHLKCLGLGSLPSLKCIIEEGNASMDDNKKAGNLTLDGFPCADGLSCFPSLKILRLYELPKLRKWGRSVSEMLNKEDDHQVVGTSSVDLAAVKLQSMYLPQLQTLSIQGCPELVFNLLCPEVNLLNFENFNERLQILSRINMQPDEKKGETSASNNNPSNSFSKLVPILKDVFTSKISWLKTLPMESFQQLTYLCIIDENVESFEEIEDVFRCCSSSLRRLVLIRCRKLGSIDGVLEHLIALKQFDILDCPALKLEEESKPWRCLQYSLLELTLRELPLMKNLPNWIQYMASLERLHIHECKALESIPAWMSKLTSLRTLQVFRCSASLQKRCKEITGEDWPYIHHIPDIRINSV
ncbi:unnamed protein product [Amaranthus hypochondriacus]